MSAWFENPASGYFGVSRGQLAVGGIPIRVIVEQYGTPLFVYDAVILEKKWRLLRDNLPAEFSISYSIKANPNPAFLKYFLARGSGLEIASGGEFHIAVRSGCPPDRMLFAGPGKSESELQVAVSNGIDEIHVESLLEIERIRKICRSLGRKARVTVRVNANSAAQGGAMRMGGKAVPFGVDEEQLDIVLDRLLADETFDFRGLHFYLGTQILDYRVLIRQYREALKTATKVGGRIRRPLASIDFGGGLGIPYFADECPLEIEKFGAALRALLAEIANQPEFAGTQFVVEPGRYLVGEAGVYVVQVNDVKVSRGKTFVLVDGGMNHHLAASGNLGQVIKRNFPVGVLNKLTELSVEKVDIVGPLCTPLDVLARDVELPRTEVGDFVGVFQSGAYVRSASPLGFLSYPTPPEVLIQNGEARLIRMRGGYDHLLADIPSDF